VDSQVKTADGQLFDVLFVGTDNGRILKIVQPTQLAGQQPLLVEEIQATPTNQPILGENINPNYAELLRSRNRKEALHFGGFCSNLYT
jgi:Sema domain